MNSSLPRIVVVGGGAGGLELVTRLGDKYGKRATADITLVDANLTHLWKPLLHEVAAGSLNSHEDELNYLTHAKTHHFRFRLGRVDGLDRERREIHIAPTRDEAGGEIIPRRTIGYDLLIFAVGSTTHDFGLPGVREHCWFLDTRAQADRFHQHLLRCFFTVVTQQEPLRENQLNIAIAGAGATGVELAAELRYAVGIIAQHALDPDTPQPEFRFTLIEAADRVLPALPKRISANTQILLKNISVDVQLGERIARADEEGFHTGSGRDFPAKTMVWATGIKAPDWMKNLDGLETNKINQLAVRPTLQTTRDELIFALGDCAAAPQPGSDQPVPPRAQAAHQQAAMLVKSVKCWMKGKPLPEYTYRDYGSLVNLSRYGTFGNLMGNVGRRAGMVMVEGRLARLAYLMLYKMHQLSLHGIPRVSLVTLANLLTRSTRPRLKLH